MLNPTAVSYTYPETQSLGFISQTIIEGFVSQQVSTPTADKLVLTSGVVDMLDVVVVGAASGAVGAVLAIAFWLGWMAFYE